MVRYALILSVFVLTWVGSFWILQPFGIDDQMRPDGDEVWFNRWGWDLPYDSDSAAVVLATLAAGAVALVVGVVAAWWDGRRRIGDLLPLR